MDNLRQQRHPQDIPRISEGRANLDIMEALDRDRGISHEPNFEKQAEKAGKQVKRRALQCATFTGALQATGLAAGTQAAVIWPLGLHLPEESDIGSIYVENRSGCNLNVFEGPGGSGRIIGYATKQTYRVISIADNISSVSLVVDLNATPFGDGLIIALLFSHRWSPKMGTIV